MSTVSVSLPSDGSTADVSDYNTPITTIVNEINGNLDNNNIKSGAAIATSKLAEDAGIKKTMVGTDSSWAWTSYTPTWTASTSNPTLGNGTLTGSYVQIGKTVTAQVTLTFGSTTTLGSGVYRWSLPVTAASKRFVGSGWALRSGSAFEAWPVSNIDPFAAIRTGDMSIINAGGGLSSTTRPWANGDIFAIEITYEVA